MRRGDHAVRSGRRSQATGEGTRPILGRSGLEKKSQIRDAGPMQVSSRALKDLLGDWRAAPGPAHRNLADQLRILVLDGRLPLDSTMPGERDLSAALGEAGNHRAIVLQGLGVLVGMLQHHGRDFGFKAVALGAVTGRQAQRFDRHHGVAVQGDQAVRGAHKIHAAPAGQLAIGLQLVLHHFGNRQFGQGFIERLLQARSQGRALDHAVVKQGFGLAVGRALQSGHGRRRVAHVSAQGLQFFQQGGGRVARRVQAHRHGHQLLLHRFVSGLRQHAGHMGGQAAGRGKSRHQRIGSGQALGLELFGQHTREGRAQFVERLGRQLFHKQFHQQILCRHVVLPHAAFLGI